MASNNNNNNNNLNIEVVAAEQEAATVVSNNSMIPSDIEAKIPCRRPAGDVCICEICEATRTRMLHRLNKKASTEIENVANHKKRAREEEDDDDEEEDDSLTESSSKKPAIKDDTASTATSFDNEETRLATMTDACKTILRCIGEDPSREGLVKTPERWAKALLFMCSGYEKRPEDVTNGAVFAENHDEMVVVRDIDIHSLCEHHMVPFTGRVHIGYIPNGRILGLSKLARIAELFSRRLQVQERLTRQIADAIVETVEPLGVAVVVECTHFCMVMRGVQKTGAVTTTSSVRGCFESNPKTRAEFFSIIHGSGVKMC